MNRLVLSIIKREYDYEYVVDPSKKVRYVGIGDGEFAYTQGEILSTMGIGSCVGLIAFSKQFSYLAHIEMGNVIGFNFDKKGNCLKIGEILQRIKETSDQGKVWIGTITPQRYQNDRKWWSESSIELDEQIEKFVNYCRDTLHIEIERIPNLRSSFITLDSETGECYFQDSFSGSLVKSNIMDIEKKQWLASKVSERIEHSINDFGDTYNQLWGEDKIFMDRIKDIMKRFNKDDFGDDR